jgi:hypothetical protein
VAHTDQGRAPQARRPDHLSKCLAWAARPLPPSSQVRHRRGTEENWTQGAKSEVLSASNPPDTRGCVRAALARARLACRRRSGGAFCRWRRRAGRRAGGVWGGGRPVGSRAWTAAPGALRSGDPGSGAEVQTSRPGWQRRRRRPVRAARHCDLGTTPPRAAPPAPDRCLGSSRHALAPHLYGVRVRVVRGTRWQARDGRWG